jgi:hypothetical protein
MQKTTPVEMRFISVREMPTAIWAHTCIDLIQSKAFQFKSPHQIDTLLRAEVPKNELE